MWKVKCTSIVQMVPHSPWEEPNSLSNLPQIPRFDFDKFNLKFGQIHSLIWTNAIKNLDKYITHFGQIHSSIWTNAIWEEPNSPFPKSFTYTPRDPQSCPWEQPSLAQLNHHHFPIPPPGSGWVVDPPSYPHIYQSCSRGALSSLRSLALSPAYPRFKVIYTTLRVTLPRVKGDALKI